MSCPYISSLLFKQFQQEEVKTMTRIFVLNIFLLYCDFSLPSFDFDVAPSARKGPGSEVCWVEMYNWHHQRPVISDLYLLIKALAFACAANEIHIIRCSLCHSFVRALYEPRGQAAARQQVFVMTLMMTNPLWSAHYSSPSSSSASRFEKNKNQKKQNKNESCCCGLLSADAASTWNSDTRLSSYPSLRRCAERLSRELRKFESGLHNNGDVCSALLYI